MIRKLFRIPLFILSFCSVLVINAQLPVACFTSTDTLGCVPYTVTMHECTRGGTQIKYKFGDDPLFISDSTYTFTTPGEKDVTLIFNNVSGNNDNLITKKKFIKVIAPTLPKFNTSLCNNFLVHVNLIDLQFPKYIVDYGDGVVDTVGPNKSFTHQYPDGNQRTLSITGVISGGMCPTTSVTVVQPVSVLVTTENVRFSTNKSNSKSLDVNMNLDKFHIYSFFSTSGRNLRTISNISGPQDFTLNNVLDSCVYYTVTNACGQSKSSNSTCLTSFNVAATDSSVVLDWASNESSLDSLLVYRDNIFLKKLKLSDLKFEDFTVKCGVNYCYTLVKVFQDGTKLSPSKCITALSNTIPEKINFVKSSFDSNNNLNLSWQIPSKNTHKFSELSANSVNVLNAKTLTYTKNSFVVGECFDLTYVDSCDKKAPILNLICPVYLQFTKSNSGDYIFNWSNYSPSEAGMYYELFADSKLIYSGTSTSYTTSSLDSVQNVSEFVVKVHLNSEILSSNTLVFEQSFKVYFPTAFSPDGDGVNDTFYPKANDVKEMNLAIFNNWGQLIFSTSKFEPWDGGGNQPGTYSYVAKLESINGSVKEIRGFVLLLK